MPRAESLVESRRRKALHLKTATALLAGLLANPVVSLPGGSLFHSHGEGTDRKEQLADLAWKLAERLLRRAAKEYNIYP